ncbi:hypothetical protein C1N92_13070 [Bacillus velezensis]|uniref:ATP-binding cassette domain-containing protein n=1 Tax=Bacillus velezensis TaxID=492670 RepID=UPI000D7387FB|nr:ABC transporter ATP-binding protein [Bacillus velezensis]AWQ15727.1 hypothetical protein C1N92_13070 [Bacillus velezensis]
MIKIIGRVFKIYLHISKLNLILLLLFSLTLSILPIFSLGLTEKIGNAISGHTELHQLILLLILQSTIYICDCLITLFNNIIKNNLDYKYTYYFEKKLIEKVSRIKTSALDSSRIYNSIMQVSHIIPLIGTRFLLDIIEFSKGVISIIGIVYILKNLHWSIITLLIIISTINFFMSRLFNKEELNILNQTSETKRKKDIIWDLLKKREFAIQTRILQVSHYLIQKWSKYFWKASIPEQKLNNKREYLVQTLMITTHILQLCVLVIFVIKEWPNIPIGTFMMLLQAISLFQGYSHQIVGSLSNLHQTLIYLPLYFNILEEEEDTFKNAYNFTGLEKKIMVKDLKFKYSNSDSYSLYNVNFEILKGEKVAVVGFNGSGKTTLIKCLIGLYDNYEGNIYYDDKEVLDYNQNSLRNNIGWLAQDFVKFPFSLIENIFVGDVRKQEKHVEVPLKKSLIYDSVQSLPLGLKTMLDPAFEQGVDLSGGQWQKVALARLFFRDSNLLFMDEPTSAIDPISENKIYKNLLKQEINKTIIILTHRLNVCNLVDKVIVMKDGGVAAIGTHKELIKSSAYYRELYQSQSEDGYITKQKT